MVSCQQIQVRHFPNFWHAEFKRFAITALETNLRKKVHKGSRLLKGKHGGEKIEMVEDLKPDECPV